MENANVTANLENWASKALVHDQYFVQLLQRLASVDYLSSAHFPNKSPLETTSAYSSFLEMGGPSTYQYQYYLAAIEIMAIGSANWKLTRQQIESYPTEIGTLIGTLPNAFYDVLFTTIPELLPTLAKGSSSTLSPQHGHISVLSPVHSSVSPLKMALLQYITMFHAFFRCKGSMAIWQYVGFVKQLALLWEVMDIPFLYLLCKLVAPFVNNIVQHHEAGSVLLAFYDCLHLVNINNIYDDTHEAEQDCYLLDTILYFLQQISIEATKIPPAVRIKLKKKIHSLPKMMQLILNKTQKD